MSVSHGEDFTRVHSPSALWIQSVSNRGFEVCVREPGIISNETGVINWIAFQDQPQMTHGSVTFSGIWTTETRCDKVTFEKVRIGKLKHCTSVKQKLVAWLSLISQVTLLTV